MSYRKIYLPIKVLALLSFVSIAIKYWGPSEVGFTCCYRHMQFYTFWLMIKTTEISN